MILGTKKDLDDKVAVEDEKVKQLMSKNMIEFWFKVRIVKFRRVQRPDREWTRPSFP